MRPLMLAIVAIGCGAPPAHPASPPPLPPPPYAVAEPVSTPRLFARDAISTELPEFSISFSADGATAYFDRATADRSKFEIVASHFDRGAWQAATPLAFSTGEYRDVDPFIAGDRLYFSSNRPRPDSPPAADFDTWYVEAHGDAWSAAVHVDGAPSGPGNQLFVSIARDGTMYFQSDASGGGDIYRAPRVRDAYPAAAPIEGIDTPESEGNPAISPDGTLLVFVSERAGGIGGSDLYASRFREGAWSPPRNLGPTINSPQSDFAPAFSPDGRYLWFTSERPGVVPAPETGRPPGDIYQIDVAAFGM